MRKARRKIIPSQFKTLFIVWFLSLKKFKLGGFYTPSLNYKLMLRLPSLEQQDEAEPDQGSQ